MLQRIQTLYLLIVSVLTALLFFFPSAFGRGVDNFSVDVYFSFPLIALSLLLSVSCIFLYKNRSLQIKLNYMNIVVFIAMYAVACWQIFNLPHELNEMGFNLTGAIPLINIILILQAIFRIKKDEKLVRSLDRLR